MGKSTISLAIFDSYVSVYQRVFSRDPPWRVLQDLYDIYVKNTFLVFEVESDHEGGKIHRGRRAVSCPGFSRSTVSPTAAWLKCDEASAKVGRSSHKMLKVDILIFKWYIYIYIIEGSLEVKLPTIWTVEKQRWEESEEKRSEERRCRCAKR